MSQSHSLSISTTAVISSSITRSSCAIIALSIAFPVSFPPIPIRRSKVPRISTIVIRSASPVNSHDANDEEDTTSEVQDLRVPDHWLLPSKAREVRYSIRSPTLIEQIFQLSIQIQHSSNMRAQESEWLKITLHKWLDDEYCPEETNVEISSVAAQSYYESLVGKRTDLGEILLKMARDLESISYQESFHGAFSSANAAVSLIVQRIEIQGISASS